MEIKPYLNFDGRCDEAIEYYKEILGAELQFRMLFADSPPESCSGKNSQVIPEKVMHAELKIGDAKLMMSDCFAKGNPTFQGITLSLAVEDEQAAREKFELLSSEGEITMPLAPTFFSSSFGMLVDRFGVAWQVMVPTPVRA